MRSESGETTDYTILSSIVVVENNSLFRGGLRALLESWDDLVVLAAMADMESALDTVVNGRPNIVLFGVEDWSAAVASALDQLFRAVPGQRVIVLSQGSRPGGAEAFLSRGVRGYLPKDISGDHLVSVLREVSQDDHRIFVSVPRSGIPSILAGTGVTLSKREQEIMALVAQALSNAQIARQLCITKGTVKRHLRNIFVKLDAVSRMDAVNKARAAALLTPE